MTFNTDTFEYFDPDCRKRDQLPQILGGNLALPDFMSDQEDGSSWLEMARSSTAEARKLVPLELAERLTVLPLTIVRHRNLDPALLALFPEPLAMEDFDQIRFVAGYDLITECVPRELLKKAIHAAYRGNETALSEAVTRANLNGREIAVVSKSNNEDNQHEIPALVRSILDRGITLASSDIHLEPIGSSYRIRFRVDGTLRDDPRFYLIDTIGRQIVRRIKVLSLLDTTQQHRPQEGAFEHQRQAGIVRVRVSIFPQLEGEKVVLRLLDQQYLAGLKPGENGFSQLGMTPDQERILISHIGAGFGTALFVGPTGSGKSTLLYTVLQYLNTPWRNIITLEDPVERRIQGLNQTEVKREFDLDYSNLLPPLLRQDPDVIMIGEIRDRPTAEAAFRAGVTGHLVLSTIHAGNCIETFGRLFQLELQPKAVFSSLRLIVAQRLLPKNCRFCLQRERANEFLLRIFNLSDETEIASSTGCEQCDFSGRQGRLGVFELLSLNETLREKYLSVFDVPIETLAQKYRDNFYCGLRDLALEGGYQPFAFQVREALQRGIISPAAALRSVGIPPEIVGYAH